MIEDIWKTMLSLTVVIPIFVLLFILYIPFKIFGIDLIRTVEGKLDDVLR
jgi:hypothetical protein